MPDVCVIANSLKAVYVNNVEYLLKTLNTQQDYVTKVFTVVIILLLLVVFSVNSRFLL